MIGGSTKLQLQRKKETGKTAIGTAIVGWEDVITLIGWLDLNSGDTKTTVFDARIQQSTHVFICDYRFIDVPEAEELRAVIDGKIYQVTVMDDPMELHRQWEIYLAYTGGQRHGL